VLERVAPALLDTEHEGESDAVALPLDDGVPVPLALALPELLPLLVDVVDGEPPMVRLDVCGRTRGRYGEAGSQRRTQAGSAWHVWLQLRVLRGIVPHRGSC
jgi:hypothetical protein